MKRIDIRHPSELLILLRHGKVHFTMPLAHRIVGNTDSIFLASFPRSGNTWIRTILCNLLVTEAKGDPQIFNQVIPDISLKRLRKGGGKHFQILKTHAKFQREINKAIYVVRDGRDALVSFYHYTITRNSKDMSFSKWFDAYARGLYGPLWHENVESWLMKGQDILGESLLVLRFEDIKRDPLHCVRKIVDFVKLSVSNIEIETAVELSSLKQARKWEEYYLGQPETPNMSFYRGGEIGQWLDYFNESDHTLFWNLSHRAMDLANYSKQ